MTTEPRAAEPLDSSRGDESDLPRMSFLEHLEELRRRILFSVVAVFVAFLVCWSFAPEIFRWIQAPIIDILPAGEKLAYTRLAAPFFLYMKVAFFAGIFLASPVMLWQLWLFIAPGLYRRERIYAAPFIIFSTLFFVAGGWFGYEVVFPMACEILRRDGQGLQAGHHGRRLLLGSRASSSSGWGSSSRRRSSSSSSRASASSRRSSCCGSSSTPSLIIFIIAAIITPTPDMVTQSALAIPMILLYLLGVGIAMAFAKKDDRRK